MPRDTFHDDIAEQEQPLRRFRRRRLTRRIRRRDAEVVITPHSHYFIEGSQPTLAPAASADASHCFHMNELHRIPHGLPQRRLGARCCFDISYLSPERAAASRACQPTIRRHRVLMPPAFRFQRSHAGELASRRSAILIPLGLPLLLLCRSFRYQPAHRVSPSGIIDGLPPLTPSPALQVGRRARRRAARGSRKCHTARTITAPMSDGCHSTATSFSVFWRRFDGTSLRLQQV